MKITEIHDLRIGNKVVGALRVYFEGSGDPRDSHQIIGVSVDGYGIGDVTPSERVEMMEPFTIG